MGQQYLMDGNVVIDYLSNNLPKTGMEFINTIVDSFATVSVITKMEVLGFKTKEYESGYFAIRCLKNTKSNPK